MTFRIPKMVMTVQTIAPKCQKRLIGHIPHLKKLLLAMLLRKTVNCIVRQMRAVVAVLELTMLHANGLHYQL